MPTPERISKSWAIHERNRKAQERREQPLVTLPSWDTVSSMLDVRTRYDPDANNFIDGHRQLLKFFYDGWFDVAAGRGRKKLDKLMRAYTENEKSKYYNPQLIDDAAPYISMIRDSFPQFRTRR